MAGWNTPAGNAAISKRPCDQKTRWGPWRSVARNRSFSPDSCRTGRMPMTAALDPDSDILPQRHTATYARRATNIPFIHFPVRAESPRTIGQGLLRVMPSVRSEVSNRLIAATVPGGL
jgi:hypothetical protein